MQGHGYYGHFFTRKLPPFKSFHLDDYRLSLCSNYFFFHYYSYMIPSRNKKHFKTISFDHVSFCISASLDFKVFKL